MSIHPIQSKFHYCPAGLLWVFYSLQAEAYPDLLPTPCIHRAIMILQRQHQATV